MKRIFEKSCGETDQPGGGGDRKEAGSKRGPGAAVGRAAFTRAQGRARRPVPASRRPVPATRRPVPAPGLLGQAPVRSRRARLGRPGCHGRLPCSAHGRLSTCRASSASRSLGAAAPACSFSRTALGVLYGGRRRLNPSPPFIRTCERRTCPDLSRLPKQIPLARDATRRWPRQRPDRGPLPPSPAPRARTAEGRALLPPEPWASRHLRAQRGAARDPVHTGLKLSPAGLQVLG